VIKNVLPFRCLGIVLLVAVLITFFGLFTFYSFFFMTCPCFLDVCLVVVTGLSLPRIDIRLPAAELSPVDFFFLYSYSGFLTRIDATNICVAGWLPPSTLLPCISPTTFTDKIPWRLLCAVRSCCIWWLFTRTPCECFRPPLFLTHSHLCVRFLVTVYILLFCEFSLPLYRLRQRSHLYFPAVVSCCWGGLSIANVGVDVLSLFSYSESRLRARLISVTSPSFCPLSVLCLHWFLTRSFAYRQIHLPLMC